MTNLDVWLWLAALATMLAAALAHYGRGPVAVQFVAALAAIMLAAACLGRAVSRIGDRLSPGAVGLFNAVTGNLPELIIGTFALRRGLDTIVQTTILGSMRSMLLLSNGLAFVAGGLRHGSMDLNVERAQSTRVMLVLMTAILTAPAVAVALHTPVAGHAHSVSMFGAVALLVVFIVTLPSLVRRVVANDDDPRLPSPADLGGRMSLGLVLGLIGASGLLLSFESDWLTSALEPAIDALHLAVGFTGLFLVAIVGNLSQIGPSVQLALQGDANTATEINMQGALQVSLMLTPLFTLIAPLVGNHTFTLIFSPLAVVAVIVSTLLVVFVILDGKTNHLEGLMLLALYAVLGSLFWWS